MTSEGFSPETQHQAAVFDHIGEQYQTVFGSNPTQVSAVEWLAQRLPAGGRILDAGCGTGIPTARMLVDAGHHVLGIDIAQEMIRIARQQVPQATFEQIDITNATFEPASFHAITAFFSLLMLRRTAIEATLRRFTTWLRPPGYLLLAMVEGDFDYFEVPFLGQTLHVSAYPRHELQALLQAHAWNVLEYQAVEFQPSDSASPETQLFFFCRYQP